MYCRLFQLDEEITVGAGQKDQHAECTRLNGMVYVSLPYDQKRWSRFLVHKVVFFLHCRKHRKHFS